MKKDLKLEIKYREINSIIGYVNNTRIHSEEQISQIKSSIAEFGMVNPIGLHNGVVVFGHGRLEALRQLDYSEVPTIDLSHLSEAQKKALIIADNKIALNSEWDYDLLKVELEGLKDDDFNLDLLGFSETELEGLIDEDLDLSILDELEDGVVEDFEESLKRAIQIEFNIEDYERAREAISYWRDKGANVGYMVLHHLEKEMNTHDTNEVVEKYNELKENDSTDTE